MHSTQFQRKHSNLGSKVWIVLTSGLPVYIQTSALLYNINVFYMITHICLDKSHPLVSLWRNQTEGYDSRKYISRSQSPIKKSTEFHYCICYPQVFCRNRTKCTISGYAGENDTTMIISMLPTAQSQLKKNQRHSILYLVIQCLNKTLCQILSDNLVSMKVIVAIYKSRWPSIGTQEKSNTKVWWYR